jgi:flagellar biosynthesis protein FlhF
MLIKRFESKTMAEALALVRAELGPDAIVLGTKTLRRERSRFGLFAETRVEVTAGVDRDAVPGAPASGAASGAPQRGAVDPSWKELKLARALVEPLEAELRELRVAFDRVASAAPPPSFAEEVALLRTLARGLSTSMAAPQGAVARFRAAGVAPLHCPSLAREAERFEREGADRETAALASLARCVEWRLATPRAGEPRARMLIGAAGVGKTTTIAKLAARAQAKRVRIVTMDLGRRGESERLAALAREIDVKFSALDRPDKLAELARKRRDEILLVDTPASGRRAADALAELARIREALGEPEVLLVVSATTKERDLRAQVARHAALAPSSLAVTHWDESTGASDLLNVLLDDGAPPLAFLTTGPRVPDDLELPDPHTLARAVLQGAA